VSFATNDERTAKRVSDALGAFGTRFLLARGAAAACSPSGPAGFVALPAKHGTGPKFGHEQNLGEAATFFLWRLRQDNNQTWFPGWQSHYNSLILNPLGIA
jgi:hypothetical protein